MGFFEKLRQVLQHVLITSADNIIEKREEKVKVLSCS